MKPEEFKAMASYMWNFVGDTTEDHKSDIYWAIKEKLSTLYELGAEAFTGENFLRIVTDVSEETGYDINEVVDRFIFDNPAFDARLMEAYNSSKIKAES